MQSYNNQESVEVADEHVAAGVYDSSQLIHVEPTSSYGPKHLLYEVGFNTVGPLYLHTTIFKAPLIGSLAFPTARGHELEESKEDELLPSPTSSISAKKDSNDVARVHRKTSKKDNSDVVLEEPLDSPDVIVIEFPIVGTAEPEQDELLLGRIIAGRQRVESKRGRSSTCTLMFPIVT